MLFSVGMLVLVGIMAAAPDGYAAPRDGSFTLARDGKPAATIVVSTKASTAAQFAAAELREHVRKITGAALPVVTDERPVAGPRILVGESEATRKLRLPPLKYQEYLIRFLPETLVLMGRDAPPAGPDARLPERVPGKFGKGARFDGAHKAVAALECGFDDEVGSLEAWVWVPAAQSERHGTILRLDGSDPWTYHIVQRDMKSNRISYTTYDGTNGHGLGAEVAEGWHHIVATHDLRAGKMELFIDGVSRGTTTFVRTTCKGAVLHIGGLPAAGSDVGNPFEGIIDEVRVSRVVRPGAVPERPYEADADTTLLYHFDEEAGNPVDATGRGPSAVPPDLFEERGTLDAVYDFLERFCDVRWYAPGEIGLVCPEKPTLAVKGREVRRAPAMIHRWITPTPLYLPGPPDRVPAGDVHLWKLRMRIGGQPFWVCHSFEGYYDRFLKEHPDWFAQGYDGKPPQMCFTNPEFIRQVVQDARDFFDGKGAKSGATAMGDVFGLVPMDNDRWCKCARCQAELDPVEAKNPQFNNGEASDYIFGFVNKVAREVGKTHPEKWIGALAYFDYAYYPKKERPEPNVVVQTCLHTRNWWCPSMEANDRKVLDEFRRRDPQRPLYLWLYYCFPALNAQSGSFHYFPGFFARAVVEQMKWYHKQRIRGIFMEHSSEFGQSTLMDQLEFYLTLKLADDPSLDGGKLIDEFFRRYYGAAGKPMRALYQRIEQTFSDPKCYPPEIQRSPGHQHQTEALAWGSLGTEERMAEFAKLMDAVRAAARTPVERERVLLFEKGLWSYMVEGRRKYGERAGRRGQAPPKARVPRVPAAGGDPGKVDWTQAADLGRWSTLSGDATERGVESRVAHDGTHLYLELVEACDATKLVNGRDVWEGDDWEAFFARERGGAYRQLCIGPDGRHTASARGGTETVWESGAVVVSEASSAERWRVRVALPLSRLVPGGARPGTSVFAGLYRASPGAADLLAWSPNFSGGFHDTSRLGELVLE